MGVVEEGFRGDAADVQAGAAEGAALFYACDLVSSISMRMRRVLMRLS